MESKELTTFFYESYNYNGISFDKTFDPPKAVTQRNKRNTIMLNNNLLRFQFCD